MTTVLYGTGTYGAYRYGGDTPPDPPTWKVEVQTTSGWVDVTCDVRTIDIDRGRSSALEAFRAGTAVLTFANFTSRYSPWNPAGIWQAASPYAVGVPIRVSLVYLGATSVRFTGTTDSVIDSWPDTVDALATVYATDDMKRLARHNGGPRAVVGDNELTGARISRLADDGGWSAARAIDAGTIRVQATDLNGVTIDLMRQIGETEWGWLYVRADGALIFRQRDALQTDPRMMNVQYTFVDQHGLGVAGVCYSDLSLPVDDDAVVNQANVTPPGLALSSASDAASVAWFGPRSWSRTDLPFKVQTDALGLAQLVVLEQKNSARRVDSVSFRASASEEGWGAGAGIRMLDRVRVLRGYPGGTFSLDAELIVEGVHHRVEADGTASPNVWDVKLSTSTALKVAGFGQWDVGLWDTALWGV